MPFNRQSSIVHRQLLVRRALLQWFSRSARPLPWRETQDPYAVWVSEVMLQQTQVGTVVPYYRRFLAALPTLQHLAAAPLDRVLELWSGLGYYRRARDLRRAAQKMARDFEGQFPAEYSHARALPGVGDYTARAVLSIAYNLPYFVLDGNVARVAARLGALRGSLNRPAFRRAVERELDGLLSRKQPGNFNQAVMELGQTICLPRAPRCQACPVRKWCRAYHMGKPESYPEPKPRRATESRYLAVAVICRGQNNGRGGRSADCALSNPPAHTSGLVQTPGRQTDRRRHVALIRGLDDGLMPDLWNFPAAFGRSRRQALNRLREKLTPIVSGPIEWISTSSVAELKHGITYRSILVDLYPAKVRGTCAGNGLHWFALSRLTHLAVSTLARKIAARITED